LKSATDKVLTRWAPAAALAAGAISAFAFQPVDLWPLMPVAFVLLLELLWQTRTLWRALLTGYLFGLGQFVVGFNWIATAFTYQAAMPAWLGWVAVVLLSIYLAVYPALAAGVAWRFKSCRRLALVLMLAGAWTITEWLRAGIFTGFAWNPIAVTLVPTPLITVSGLIGTYALSALVVLFAGAIWLLFDRKWAPAAIIAAAATILWLIPAPDLVSNAASPKPVRVVQPNIGQHDKWRPEFAEEAAQRLAQLSVEPGGQHPRLLLWPEAAVTEPLEDDRPGIFAADAAWERQRAASLLQPGEFLMTGGIAVLSKDGISISAATNSVFVLAPGGAIVSRYDKAHLVPYGEYLPMRPLLSALGLSRLAPGDADFASGPGPQTINLPGWGKIGFQICYEIIFSGHVIDERNRPDFLFNPSNDAWFGRWGPPQHLAQARLRAAEEGIPIIRSTPTGISAIVDARGHVIQSLPWRTAGVIDSIVPPATTAPTLFARFGNIIPLLLSFLLIAGGIALGRSERYRRI
jgi:apolipoprotein N-acyltransferase